MKLKKELEEMFDFFINRNETKKEYKARISKRVNEIIHGINTTTLEMVNLQALFECRAKVLFINHNPIHFAGITREEFMLRKGNANDYEKYIHAVYFDHLDEKKFLEAKTACWDKMITACWDKMIKDQQQSIDDDVYYYRLLDDENLENMFDFSNSPKRQVIRRPYSYVKKPNKKIHF